MVPPVTAAEVVTIGTIFDIKRYAIHDGPGIRTTVFLKGCPLTCPWCHNPEGKRKEPEIMWWKERCITCKECQNVCPQTAISFSPEFALDRKKCDLCRECTIVCPSGALQIVGEDMTVPQVIKEIEKDTIFYDESGGGVTFSGGEPLMQPDFLYTLLKECQSQSIHTAVDTCGYAHSKILLRISEQVDLFLYDVKVINDETHKETTGVSNRLILENLKMLPHKDVIVRFPLILGLNDSEKDIAELGEFLSSLKTINTVSILPYHRGGAGKAARLLNPQPHFVGEPPSAETLDAITKKLKNFGLHVSIGG